ncbi:APC family permease [Niveispirillum cyanobacteriorum]|uniref:Amino acid permease n=1 Tax=Niveispirillum cyanobacteriorum TaxID=1612173 RepID=A0A2K9NHU3_9PROT|nr:amino acid permease [Niveispirillum cyanobacteriorum]AUN32662.1 amino acid permease [Niveispirillum cyanobacteriorum]GGE83067.1 amino acid transporter [Niveispirillum cyanobacteriorum]
MDKPPRSFLMRKPMEMARRDANSGGMTRTLGPWQLIFIGIGCIVGAGVYVMTGAAAAHYAGPAVILSFLIAALACGFICLCYAELASVLPLSGASYAYAYTVLGEVFAWGLGWMLMLEFGLAGAALAVGFSGYLTSLLGDFGVVVPAALSTSWLRTQGEPGGVTLIADGGINLVAVAALGLVAWVLVRGIRQSAAVNTVLVVVKVGVLIGFVLVGAGRVDSANWLPFIPENEGGFRYGVPGIFRAASILFFAYLGFEAVATAAAEAKRPQRDVPLGILGALVASSVLYGAVALVMTGLVPFTALDVPDPIAVAVGAVGMPVMAVIIKVGALTGLASVLLINTYAQSRVCHAMSSDGLLPPRFSGLHPRFHTPGFATIIVAGISAVAAALLPIALLADLVSLGTIAVFSTVAIAVMKLRTTHPDLPRPFKVPLGGIWVGGVWIGTVPVLALASCVMMAVPVLDDIVLRAIQGDWAPALILLAYIACGVALYLGYGYRKARIRAGG